MSDQKYGMLSHLKQDIPAGIVVFLVAMPLCLGIALASGTPLFSGIIAGVVGGIVVALASGSPLGVSGPAAGLVAIVLAALDQLPSFEVFLLCVVLAGVFQVILGLLKAGVIGYYFPSSVIKGMLAGIGIIIFLKQIPHAVGYDADPEGDWAFFQTDGHTTFSDLFYAFEFINPGAVVIALLSLAILILWQSRAFREMSFTRIIQGPLVVVVVGILMALVYKNTNLFELGQDHLVNIPVAGDFASFIGQFTTPDFSAITDPDIYVIALTIAIVASLETLLCVEATDKLDPLKRITPTNRELLAQGAGNIISGLIGGLPLTQVIVRSSANIQSGGITKTSALFHGILLLVTAALIPTVLNLIPLSALAAILLVIGYKLAQPALFKEMYAKGMDQFIPFMVTVLGIVFTDLLIGISLGLAVGIIQILWINYKTPYHFDPEKVKPGKPIYIELSEDVSFLNKAGIIHTLELIPEGCHVIVDAHKTKTMHPDILEIFEDFQINATSRGIEYECVGFERFGLGSSPILNFSAHLQDRKVQS